MGDYEACAGMYEGLYEEDNQDTGVLVNAAAAHISRDHPREALELLKDPPTSPSARPSLPSVSCIPSCPVRPVCPDPAIPSVPSCLSL